MDRVADLRADYNRLGDLLAAADGRDAAGLARERRLIGELLDSLEGSEEVPLVDQLAPRRRARTSTTGAAVRRRKSG